MGTVYGGAQDETPTPLKPLPTDKVLSINAQEDLFVKAYEAVGPSTIEREKTIIPGLEPMIRMHYSYVRGLVEQSPEHVELLQSFWHDVCPIIETNLTIMNMRAITYQLSFLLTDLQQAGKPSIEPALTIEEIEELDKTGGWWWGNFYKSGCWKEIKSCQTLVNPDRPSYSYENDPYLSKKDRFPCGAIFCSKKGAFSYERFAKNYLERSWVLHLAALSFTDTGPHGGTVHESAHYLYHDWQHEQEFSDALYFEQQKFDQDSRTMGMNEWDTRKDLLKKIYASPHQQKRNNIAIFLLEHQEPASLLDEALS